MNDENKRKNILEELERAAKTLKAASLLYEAGLLSDAISRLYYFLLYNVRALLLTKGLEAKSHEGALRLFGLHFIKEKIFSAKSSHIFSKLMFTSCPSSALVAGVKMGAESLSDS